MGGCCNKREMNPNPASASQKAQVPAGGIISQDVPKLLEFTTSYFTQFPLNEIIVLNIHKDQFKNFITQLSRFIQVIKDKTQKIMVPVAIQKSPLNPDTEMIIIMRTVTSLQKIYFLTKPLPTDVNILAKNFQVRAFQFISTTGVEARALQLQNDIFNSYKNDGLLLIGGVQDKGKGNSMQLLFYKQEKVQTADKAQDKKMQDELDASYQLTIRTIEDKSSKESLEQFLNQTQLVDNNVLRAIVTYEDVASRIHFVFLQHFDGDKLYLVSQVVKFLSEYQAQLIQSKKATPTFDEQAAKEELMAKLSDHLQKQDNNLTNSACNILVNTDLSDSLIISTK